MNETVMCSWCNERIAMMEITTNNGVWYICNACIPEDREIFPKCQKILKVSDIDYDDAIKAALVNSKE